MARSPGMMSNFGPRMIHHGLGTLQLVIQPLYRMYFSPMPLGPFAFEMVRTGAGQDVRAGHDLGWSFPNHVVEFAGLLRSVLYSRWSHQSRSFLSKF